MPKSLALCDLFSFTYLCCINQEIQPILIYNLAAQSHVQVSFETPEYTANGDALGTLGILEAIRIFGLAQKTKFYQASTSELYGGMEENKNECGFYDEKTPFYPRSPYAVAKLYGYWIMVNYREAYGMYACNGILLNHESPIRGENFVTRKITCFTFRIAISMRIIMLQEDNPEDIVLAIGKAYIENDLCDSDFDKLGIKLVWDGE
jgi:GDPmannose 4,6-dehydratase